MPERFESCDRRGWHMKISLLCTFEPHTAGGILTAGRAKALAQLGHEICLVFQPFKFTQRQVFVQPVIEGVSVRYQRSAFFAERGVLKLLFAPVFLFFDFPRLLNLLRKAEMVIVHKPLPVSFFYMFFLKTFGFKGILCCVHSDWEGIGGYADINSARSLMQKLIITFCEETTPHLCDVTYCASKALLARFSLSGKIAPQCIYLPCGGEEFEAAPKTFTERVWTVMYAGTYKSRATADFLIHIAQFVLEKKPDFRFVLLGEGPFLCYLQERNHALALENQVSIPGHIPHTQVIQYLREAHFALNYLPAEYPETLIEMSRSSTKLFEYLCAGTVVVGSDFGEPREILAGNHAGFLVANEIESFGKRLIALSKMEPRALVEISQNAKRLFHQHLSHRVLMERLVAFAAKDISMR